MNVDRRVAVQDHDKVIAVRRDLVVIPLIRLEGVLLRGFGSIDDAAGVVAGRLLPPDLHFVSAVFLRRTHVHAAVRVGAAFEIDRQHEILIALIGIQIAGRLAASRQRSVDDFPMRAAGRHR